LNQQGIHKTQEFARFCEANWCADSHPYPEFGLAPVWRTVECLGLEFLVSRHFILPLGVILLFGPRRSHSSIPARTMVRPSRAAAVKDGPTWGPPEGLVLDGREHDGRLVCVGIGRETTLVFDRG
jgi:hypothetical protein